MAANSKGNRSRPVSVYVVGFVALFTFAAGAGLVGLAVADHLSDRLLILTLAGLLVFVAAALVFYQGVVRPIAELSAGVRAATTHMLAGPITVSGPAEVSSLAHDINQMIAKARADFEATSRLAAIVGSSADAIIGTTLDGVITSWNAGAEQEYGYARDEIIGRSVSALYPPDRADELAPILDGIRRGERVEHFETKRARKDGTILDVSISVSPIRDASGAVAGASAVIRNMTERNRLEAHRRALEHQLHQSERLESLGQLAGGVAHDFNNLLAVIMNFAAFAAEETTDKPAARADIEQIQAAAQRAARITKQLLIVGRRQAAQPETLGLNAIVADTHDLLSSAVGAGIEIRVDPAADLPTIEADRAQVEQVLLNLAVNARDAMPQGGTLTIETSLAELDERQARSRPGVSPGRYAELAVSDTGTGMSGEVKAHIFEPFFTTKPVGQGTGLGLATVYGIVTGAGGSTSVFSEEGVGTTFRLLFPATGAAAPATPTVDIPDARGNGQTILVVDDEQPVLELTSRILRQNGYATIEADTFDLALSLASSQDFQLLLTDSVMPGMSGPTLAERVLKLRPGLPVLYMSGYSAEALSARRIHDEGAEFIQKPFTRHTLLEKVDAALSTPPKRHQAGRDGDEHIPPPVC